MIDILRRFVGVRYEYANHFDRQRAVGLIILSGILTSMMLAYDLFVIVPGILSGAAALPRALVFLLILPVLAALIYGFVQSGRLQPAVWLFLGALYFGVLPFVLSASGRSTPVLLFIVAIAAGVLLNRRQFVVALLLLLVTLAAHASIQSQAVQAGTAESADTILTDFGLMVFTLLTCSVLLYAFSGSAHRLTEISVADIRHFRIVSGFSHTGAEDSLLTKALRAIQSDLGYSLGQIFLIEADAGVQRRIRLGMGQSDITSSPVVNRGNTLVVNEVVSTRQPVTVTTQDEQPRRSHLAESARRALAVPILSGDQVLGVIDVQSNSDQPFTANQIEAFQTLGRRLGEALVQVRLISDLHQSLREREDAAAYMRTQLTEMQGGNRRLLQSGWNRYLQSRGAMFGYDLQETDGGIVPASDLPSEILTALTHGDVFVETRADEQIINAPIISRGEMLGAMSFVVPADRVIGEDEIEMVRTIASRLGLALENNRLLEQTQAQARRERKASEVANVLLTATSIESLMELAAQNFNEALNAINTRIYLEPGVVSEPPATRGEPA